MAAPNIADVTSIIGKTTGARLTTTITTALLVCPSNKVLKINSIIVSNVDGVVGADTTVMFNDSSGGSYQIGNIIVPIESTLIMLGKDAPIYLEEGDQIEGGTASADAADIIISYEELDDA